jgi:phosphoglycerol transferase MdoB-like AlkP superfamily enzyme
MGTEASDKHIGWRASRFSLALCWLGTLMAGWFVLRLIFFLAFRPAGVPTSEAGLALVMGLYRDFFVAWLLTLPLLAWLQLAPDPWFRARWCRWLFWLSSFVFWFVEIFLLFTEFFFFEEFKSRFNTVAVDYLLYPREVFINIWDSYHVGVVLAVCAGLSLGWVWLAARHFGPMWDCPRATQRRWLPLAAAALVAAILAPTIRLKGTHVSNDRTLNEIANNGAIAFVAAGWTRHLDYAAFYKTMPRDEAYQRVRRMLASTNTQFLAEGCSILRQVGGDPTRARMNVVIILEESLGSEFWGCLGRTNSLTPEMDRLAAAEGLLFTNLYASGNRTVRGMEGALSSFPPLPGDSVVKRDLSDNVETVARVLKRDGYATLFLYGGRGLFDGMRSYAVRNGYDRFIEQKHFEQPTFTTIWGVCDEDLFARAIEEFRALDRAGTPFCGTILSVSNHKPYTYPPGRIPENPNERRRENAVKYSDFALGEFFRAARKEAFWTNTVFAVVADHGARVYGEQSIPIQSYEIPLVIAGPAVVKQPGRVGHLGGSLDVAPTLLGLVGRPYRTLFFGQDLLQGPPSAGRAVLNHNRDIGMLVGDRLVVLGLMQTSEFYGGDPKVVEMKLLPSITESDRELERDVIALYQVADDLYTHQQYRIDESLPARGTASTAVGQAANR